MSQNNIRTSGDTFTHFTNPNREFLPYPKRVSLAALVDGREDALVDPEGHGGGEQGQRQVPAHRQE